MTPAQQKAFSADIAFLRERGWLGKGYCYWADEPAPKDYPRIVELAKQAHAAGADVPFLMTEQPEPALFGAVDLWCPVLGMYAARAKQCRERQKLGEHVWWYVACGPLPPWPNYMLTNAPLDARVLSWLQVKYGVEGELYWSTTCWPGDVWSEGLSRVYPGDGYLCYPGKPRGARGPVTSIRAEMIRAGKQDIELIWLLRRLAAKRAKQEATEQVIRRAIARVCTDFTHFTKRDADLDAARRMILSQLVALQE